MIDIISNVIGALAVLLASMYVWGKLYCEKINLKSRKVYFAILVAIILILLNYFYTFVFIRIFLGTLIFLMLNKFIFNKDYKLAIISTVFSQLILFFADVLFGVIVIYIFRIDMISISNFYGTLMANIFAFVLSMFIVNLHFIKKIYDIVIDFVDNIRQQKVILFAFLIIVSLNFLLALIYFKLNIYAVFIINVVLIFIYSYVILKTLETSSKNQTIMSENDSLMESLNEYENMVDRQRIDNHENKNQLLIIKNMIKKNDKDVVKYIDTIVKDEKEDDEVLYTKVKTIPSGGLQGIIYQKMLIMKDKHILFSLNVSRDVRKIELENLNMDDNYRLCKIVGVFLDNAIEESLKINGGCIMISLYADDNNLVIEISNKFDGDIDISRIDDAGFTTKGNGHGYGLSLVKKILSETDSFINERNITKDVFKQIIKVKAK